MALVRVIPRSPTHNKWLREPPETSDALMKDPFGYDGQPISVFDVTLGVEETKAVVAHYLTLNRNNLETVWGLRIELHDLLDLGIEVRHKDGETGIADIDAKHRDLVGDRNQFEALTRRLHDAICAGEDRLRVIGPIQIKYQVQQFVLLSNEKINDRAKHRCQEILRYNEKRGK